GASAGGIPATQPRCHRRQSRGAALAKTGASRRSVRTSPPGRRELAGRPRQSAHALADATDDDHGHVIALRSLLEALERRDDALEGLLGGPGLSAQGIEQPALAEALFSPLGVEHAVGVE